MEHNYTVMKICVKGYLRYIRQAECELAELESKINKCKERLELGGVRYDSEHVSGTVGFDKIADGLIMLNEALSDYYELYAGYHDDLKRAETITSVIYPNRHVVALHEIKGMTWANIAKSMNYSERTIRNMAQNGIVEIYAEMPELFRRSEIPNAAV